MIKKIKTKIIRSDSVGIFHDSRSDARVLARQVNLLIAKVNELVEVVNILEKYKKTQEQINKTGEE